MKYLLLAIALSSSTAAFAQQGTPAPAGQEEKLIPVIYKFTSGWLVAQPSYLYRTLRDARLGRYAYRLHKGDRVADVDNVSAKGPWLRVIYDNSPDTAVYYMPASALSYKGSAPHRWTLH